MSWSVLAEWGNARVIEKFERGMINDVRLIELDGRRAVARLGKRSPESLRWEYELLEHLKANGMRVPAFVPARDGRPSVDGMVVMEYIDGHQPETPEDWKAVREYLEQLHTLTAGWPQRPGFLSSLDLVARDESMSIVDVTSLPPDVLAKCRRAWARLQGSPLSVVHGDPNSTNIRISEEGVAMFDWDEARVDASRLDIGCLLTEELRDTSLEAWESQQAFNAWDAAVCWSVAPDYAMKCVNRLVANPPATFELS